MRRAEREERGDAKTPGDPTCAQASEDVGTSILIQNCISEAPEKGPRAKLPAGTVSWSLRDPPT